VTSIDLERRVDGRKKEKVGREERREGRGMVVHRFHRISVFRNPRDFFFHQMKMAERGRERVRGKERRGKKEEGEGHL